MPSQFHQKLGGRFIRVSGNWLANELPCLLSLCDVGQYRVFLSVSNLILLLSFLTQVLFTAEGKRFKPDLRVTHVRDLNFVLRSEIFVHPDG